jgi:hypothetical protein
LSWFVAVEVWFARGFFGSLRSGGSSRFRFEDTHVGLVEVPGAVIRVPGTELPQADLGPDIAPESGPASDNGSSPSSEFHKIPVARTCAVLEFIGDFGKSRERSPA